MLIQVILLFVLLVAMIVTRRRTKQKAIRALEGYVWSVVWVGIAIVVLQPDITTRVAQFVGVGRGADLVVYGAVIVLLLLVFHLHVVHDRLERQLTELIRQDALRTLPHESKMSEDAAHGAKGN